MLSSRQVPLYVQATSNIQVNIDTEAAWKLAQDLVHQTPKDRFGFINDGASTKRMIRDMRGRTYVVDFLIGPINSWLRDYNIQSVSGMIEKDLGKEKGPDEVLRATIALYINDWNLGQQLDLIAYDEMTEKAKVEPIDPSSTEALNNVRYMHVYRALIHELTHLVDPEESDDPFAPETLGDLTTDDMSRYYNQPRELRAHFQEILEEITNEFEETDTADAALEKSYQWKEMEPYLSEENKTSIRTAVQQWFANAGL